MAGGAAGAAVALGAGFGPALVGGLSLMASDYLSVQVVCPKSATLPFALRSQDRCGKVVFLQAIAVMLEE
jgi:putative effector of murein hydrolase